MKKLVIAVVQNDDADNVVDALLDQDFRATRLASTGSSISARAPPCYGMAGTRRSFLTSIFSRQP